MGGGGDGGHGAGGLKSTRHSSAWGKERVGDAENESEMDDKEMVGV